MHKKSWQFNQCFFSNDLEHDIGFAYQLQKLLCNYFRLSYPGISNIQYFSDGCSAQYKNYKNFLNLTLHKQDLELMLCGIFSVLAIENHIVMDLVEPFKKS